MRRKICVVTGSRAEYGLLRYLMADIQADSELELQVLATGMHLSPEFGLTYKEIEADGYTINRKVEILMSSDTSVGITKSMGLGMIGFADALDALKPDLMLVLGDRFEIFAATAAALIARIPVAHLHGGEITEGAYDDSLRHAITKMSHLHFVALEEYRDRVVQLGESPDRVFQVGALGGDAIHRQQLMSRNVLEASLGFTFGERNLLVTFHPATLDDSSPEEQMTELLAALDELKDTNLIFTMPNADNASRGLINQINEFVSQRQERTKVFTSLGQQRYLSCLAHVDAVVGNSSSGILEAPSFGIGTIDIGRRQGGRIKPASVISCPPQRREIVRALKQMYSTEFQSLLKTVQNPYGDGGASGRILQILKRWSWDNLTLKRFYNFQGQS